ncbi:hypothetical protein [Rhizorhabdus argentea]|uniref:hypothetical protein n=1 Tax=Rhizorhabdus argentea TaxID=1387174 RepID=UPI0030EE2E1B
MNRICEAAAMMALGLAFAPASAQIAGSVDASARGNTPAASRAVATTETSSARADVAAAPGNDAVADTTRSAVGDVKRAVRKSRRDAAVAANSAASIEDGSTVKSSSKPLAPRSGN